MCCKRKIAVFAVVAVVAGAAVALFFMRKSAKEIREECRTKRREVFAAPLVEASGRLRAIADGRRFLVAENAKFPYVKVSFGPEVPYDYIGAMSEEAFIRFSREDLSRPETSAALKSMVDFARELLDNPGLSAYAKKSLRERLLDGMFLAGDYDGAVEFLEKGMPGRSAGWCASVIAKLKAHKAIDAGDSKDAVKQLLGFVDYMLSGEMENFEDVDPSSGIVYSRDWIVARNYMRCEKLSRESGDAEAAQDFRKKAKPFYDSALAKAKDEETSLDALRKEMESHGL